MQVLILGIDLQCFLSVLQYMYFILLHNHQLIILGVYAVLPVGLFQDQLSRQINNSRDLKVSLRKIIIFVCDILLL